MPEDPIVAAVKAMKVCRGQAKPPQKVRNSMPANVIGLTILLPFAIPMFMTLYRASLAENPGALLPLFVFGGFAAGAIITLAIGTFRPGTALLDNFFVKWIIMPTGAVVLLFLAGGQALRLIPVIGDWLLR